MSGSSDSDLTALNAAAVNLTAQFKLVGDSLAVVSDSLRTGGNSLADLDTDALNLAVGFQLVEDALDVVVGSLKTIGQFVEAFSPTTVKLFNDSMKNVQATIGKALLPAIEMATRVLDSFSGILDPIADKFQPIIERIAAILADDALPPLELFAQLLDVAADVIDIFVPYLQQAGEIVKVWTAELMTLVEVFKSLGVLSFLKGVMDQLLVVMKEVIKTFILLGATIAKFLGFDKVLASFIKNLEKQNEPAPDKALNVGIQDAAFKSIEQISKDIQQAAFAATGGKPAKKKEPDEWAADLLNQLKQIEKGQLGFGQVLENQWNKISGGARDLLNLVETGVENGINTAKQWLADLINKLNPLA